MLVGFDRTRAEQLLVSESVRVVTNIDTGAAERLVQTLGRQQTNGRVVLASAPASTPPSPADYVRTGVIGGGTAAAVSYLFVDPVLMLIIGVASGIGAAVGVGKLARKVEFLDGTPRAIPELPRALSQLPMGIAAFMEDAPEADANHLEAVQKFVFHVIGRLSDPKDLLSVLGGHDSDLGQAVTTLAIQALEAAQTGANDTLAKAAIDVGRFRDDLAAAEKLTDGSEINASLDALTEAIKSTVAALA
jgi:hypothetical protein